MRDSKLYLGDILEAIEQIRKYTKGIEFDVFKKNRLIIDGVVRNLEIIGEASKKLPADIKSKASDIEWKKISGLRNILTHEYFGIDVDIIWDIIKNKLPDLKRRANSLI